MAPAVGFAGKLVGHGYFGREHRFLGRDLPGYAQLAEQGGRRGGQELRRYLGAAHLGEHVMRDRDGAVGIAPYALHAVTDKRSRHGHEGGGFDAGHSLGQEELNRGPLGPSS